MGQEIEVAGEEIDIFTCDTGDEEDGYDILGRSYSLGKGMGTEKRTACYIYLTTHGVLSGKNFFSSSFILKIASSSIVLSILSRWVITTIKGNLNILANSKV